MPCLDICPLKFGHFSLYLGDNFGQWLNASTHSKAVIQPCCCVNKPVPQLLGVPGSSWILSSSACASSVARGRGTLRSCLNTVTILVCLVFALGLEPNCVPVDSGCWSGVTLHLLQHPHPPCLYPDAQLVSLHGLEGCSPVCTSR